MVKKVIALVLFGLLFSTMTRVCFADVSAQLEQAETYKTQGQYEQAEAIYQQILTDFPDSNDALEAQKQLTILYIKQDNQPQADAAFQQLLAGFSQHKDIAKAVWQIAKGYEEPKKYDKAVELHQYNVENFTDDVYAMWSQTEVVYLNINSGDDTAADTAFEKLVTLFSSQPTLPKEIHQIAMKYNSSERYEKALDLHQYNAEHSSKDNMYAIWSQVEIVKSHIRNAHDAAADAACDTLLSKFSNQPTLSKEVYQIADLYSKAQRNNKAAALHQYNVEHLSKDDIYSMWSLVEIVKSHFRNSNDTAADAACDILLAEFSQQPAFPIEVYQIAMRYKKSGRPEKAFQLHQYNIEHSSKDDMYTMWSKIEIIKSYIRDANDAAADEAFHKLLTEFSAQPTLPKEIYQIVDEYARAGRYDKADQLYQHVIDNWPEAEQAGLEHIGVAEINVLSFIDSEHDTAAQEALNNLIADFNDHPDLAWTLDGIAGRYEKAQKYDEARNIYKKIVTDYNDTDYAFTAQKKLAVLEIKAGDDPNAQAALDTLIADFNDHPDLPDAVFIIAEQYYNKAFFYKNQGLDTKMKDCFQKTLAICQRIITELPPSATTPEAYDFAAGCYRRLREYENAIEYYSIVVDNWPDYRYAWDVQFRIARCFEELARSGHIPKADAAALICQVCEKLITDYPDCKAVKAARNLLDRWNAIKP